MYRYPTAFSNSIVKKYNVLMTDKKLLIVTELKI
jgi:hypothetical protein